MKDIRTGEHGTIITCSNCGAEHVLLFSEFLEVCDVCGHKFKQPDEDNGEDQEPKPNGEYRHE